MACGLFGSDDYTNAFAWGDAIEAAGTPSEVAHSIAEQLEATQSQIDWKATAARVKKPADV
jgi:hypothetical protein